MSQQDTIIESLQWDMLRSEHAEKVIAYIQKLEADNKRLTEKVKRQSEELGKYKNFTFCKDCSRCYHTKVTLALKCRVWQVQVSPDGGCSRGRKIRL